MRYKRILLIFPPYRGGHFGALRPPAGLGYISQSLIESGYECDVVDMAVGYDIDYLKKRLRSFKPDLVGMSLMSFMYMDSYEIARIVKKESPQIKVVAGGPHVSTFREEVLIQCSEIDYGIVMDGEFPLLELCGGTDIRDISGLIYREDGVVHFNATGSIDRNLDRHPFPCYEGFPLERYVTEEIGIVTSRGCPFKCTYCPVGTSIGRKFRIRSPESIVREIGFWYKKGYRQFSILDDVFNLDKKRVVDICSAVTKSGYRDIELNCNNGIRADRIDHEMLSHMYAAGFRYLAFGVEGGNDKILRNIKKGESIKEIEEAIQMAIGLNFRVTLFFIIGSPGETLRDVQDSIHLARKYPIFDARFYNLIPFPASEFYEWIKTNNYFIKDPEYYLNNSSQWDNEPVFVTPEFGIEDRRRALKLANEARKEIRYRSMRRLLENRFGPVAAVVARLYVNDRFQGLLMRHRFLRRNLKRFFMRATSKAAA